MSGGSEYDVSPKDWGDLGDYLQRDDVTLLSRDEQSRHWEEWQEITHQLASLDDALLIGLVGGTGVGKSRRRQTDVPHYSIGDYSPGNPHAGQEHAGSDLKSLILSCGPLNPAMST